MDSLPQSWSVKTIAHEARNTMVIINPNPIHDERPFRHPKDNKATPYLNGPVYQVCKNGTIQKKKPSIKRKPWIILKNFAFLSICNSVHFTFTKITFTFETNSASFVLFSPFCKHQNFARVLRSESPTT